MASVFEVPPSVRMLALNIVRAMQGSMLLNLPWLQRDCRKMQTEELHGMN